MDHFIDSLKLEAVHSSETSEQTKFTVWCKNPRDNEHENL